MLGRVPTRVAKPVAHGVLDSQRDEFEAFQRALLRRDVDAKRPLDREERGPVHRARRFVDVVLACVAEFGDLPQHPGSEPRAQVGRVADCVIALECDAAGRALRMARAKRGKLLREQRLEPPRAGGEIAFRTA